MGNDTDDDTKVEFELMRIIKSVNDLQYMMTLHFDAIRARIDTLLPEPEPEPDRGNHDYSIETIRGWCKE